MKYLIYFFIPLFLISCNVKKNKKITISTPAHELVQKALEAREKSYSPYSHFKVGSAIKTANGRIYKGTNIENASYGVTICAERSALFNAVCDGDQEIETMALVLPGGGYPCGTRAIVSIS